MGNPPEKDDPKTGTVATPTGVPSLRRLGKIPLTPEQQQLKRLCKSAVNGFKDLINETINPVSN